LSEPIDVDKDGNPLTYIDIISVDDTIAEDIFVKTTSGRAKRYIREELAPRERQILTLRYGLTGDPPLTQREIAEGLGISRSYVSRIEKAALKKILDYLDQNPSLSE
jgi:RNA polymerase sporulation-specific sigma factor